MDKKILKYEKALDEIFSTKKKKKILEPLKNSTMCIILKHSPMEQDAKKEVINIETCKLGIMESVSGI